jgi:transcriptional regulator with XRE-family HTH domain
MDQPRDVTDRDPMETINARHLGAVIRDRRENLSLSLEGIAEVMGISPEDLEAIEAGRQRPTAGQLLDLSQSPFRMQVSTMFREVFIRELDEKNKQLQEQLDHAARLLRGVVDEPPLQWAEWTTKHPAGAFCCSYCPCETTHTHDAGSHDDDCLVTAAREFIVAYDAPEPSA